MSKLLVCPNCTYDILPSARFAVGQWCLAKIFEKENKNDESMSIVGLTIKRFVTEWRVRMFHVSTINLQLKILSEAEF